jgi:hypothetical protein
LMREHRLPQRRRPEGPRRRPGFFRVERPEQLWRLDVRSIWVAEHGSCYVNAAIDARDLRLGARYPVPRARGDRRDRGTSTRAGLCSLEEPACPSLIGSKKSSWLAFELRPLAIEYQQLEEVAQRQGLALDDERATPARKRDPLARPPRPNGSRRRRPSHRRPARSTRPDPVPPAER